MEKVVTVNLGGNPFTFEEGAYASLRAYLDRAEAALAANPDKAEIMRDLEQAIADKSASYLSAHKTVVSADEIARILEEMGPVEGAEQPQPGAQSETRGKKRLYRVPDNAVLGGVCSGLGAYFDIEPNLVRIGFIVLAFATHGLMVLTYILMLFIVPSARTSEDWAAANGLPFNAQEVIERAKRQAAYFAEGGWAHHRRWRRHARRYWRNYGYSYAPPPSGAPAANPPTYPAPSYATRMLAGFAAIITTIVSVALSIGFIVAIVTLATTGSLLGFAPPAGIPLWVAVVVLIFVFGVVAAPFRALRHASYAALNGGREHYYPHMGGAPMLLLLLAGWLVYTQVPSAHAWIDDLFAQIRLWSLSLSL